MRLLVTNTHAPQAYAIIRALRPHAERIVATMSGRWGAAWVASFAAHSRLVDARYRIPKPDRDWQSGILQKENTDREENYLREILRICERERIDTIFPSYDPDVYVLSKNKRRLESLGIRVPVPAFETLSVTLDKRQTMAFAEQAGFPCPKTFLPENEEHLLAIASEFGPPWVVKPRITTASKGMEIVNDRDALIESFRRVGARYRDPLIQEYIPGSQKQNFYVMVDSDESVRHIFCPRIVRHSRRLYRNSSASCVASDEHPSLPLVQRLVEQLRWKGALTVQTKIDARDGTPKLMEINPRLGSHLWYRTELGINEPLYCLRIEKGEPLPETGDWHRGTLLLDPIEDVVALCSDLVDLAAYKTRVLVLRKTPIDTLNRPLGVGELARSYGSDYLGEHQRRFSPHYTHFFGDLRANILYSLFTALYAPGGLKRIGK